LLSAPSYALPSYGIGFDYATGRVVDLDNTNNVDGAGFTGVYHPNWPLWHNIETFFQSDLFYFHSSNASMTPGFDANLWILAVAPVFRYHFLPGNNIDPFIDASVGAGYMSTSKFDDRDLGIRYTFQDTAGLGVLLGQEQQFSIAVRIVHYSNAGLSSENRGFTIPVIASLRFNF
jgi:hypothetical protein